jgi:hypothetical protein
VSVTDTVPTLRAIFAHYFGSDPVNVEAFDSVATDSVRGECVVNVIRAGAAGRVKPAKVERECLRYLIG